MFTRFFPVVLYSLIHNHGVDARQFAAQSTKKCMPGFDVAWMAELGTSAAAAPPLIMDVNADGNLEVVMATFSGDVHVISGKDGKAMHGGHWPYRLPETTVHAAPIQYDYDGDGMMDIIVTSSLGEIYVLSWQGILVTATQLKPLSIAKDWYKKTLTAEEANIHKYLHDAPTSDPAYVPVDPHVMATPVLIDLNADGTTEELIIPVTYFYDTDYYSNPEFFEQLSSYLTYPELENYLASSLVVLNLTDLQIINTIHMELTKVNAEYPGYLLFTPTVVDLDGDGGPLEIVCGSSAGHLHAFSEAGQDREGFPVPTESIHGMVTVEDVSGDGSLDLIVTDVSGNVACYSASGNLLWETQTSGSRPSGTRVADLYGDGQLQVVMTTDDGTLNVLNGKTGEILQNWPFRGKLYTPPLLTRVETVTDPVMMLLDSSGFLQLIGPDNCRQAVNIRETSLVPILSHDLIPSSQGLEFLIATKDGAVMCVKQNNRTGVLPADNSAYQEDVGIYAWPGETVSTNTFIYAKYIVTVGLPRDQVLRVLTSSFPLSLTVIDQTYTHSSQYRIQVFIGRLLLKIFTLEAPVQELLVDIPSATRPMSGQLVVRCTNQFGQVAETVLPVTFHQSISSDLQWLVVGPTVAMCVTLLFLYAFPPQELLPVYASNKHR